MKVLLVDNYDSFTYNLVHYLEQLGITVVVLRNDDPDLLSLDLSTFHGLVLSPGPGLPSESGQLMTIISKAYGTLPILGVCLGMQALAEHSGANLYNREGVMHGRTTELELGEPSLLLQGVQNLQVGLYHSWAVDPKTLNDWNLCAVALSDGAPMIIERPCDKIFAVQFHPESVLTPEGLRMMENWVKVLA